MLKKTKFGSRTNADQVLAGMDLSAKNILITGANTGIGYETARSLAAAGANVILGCRTDDKGQGAVNKILAAHPEVNARYLQLDLSSFTSIKSFAAILDWQHIDVIIGNAGIVPTSYQETEQGIEQCVGVCHFGHFALCKLLLPKLLKSQDPRVIMLSSESHRTPKKLDFDKFPLTKDNFAIFTAYGQAKLSNTLFANELQRRYGVQGLNACSLHPGTLITTDIGRYSGAFSFIMKLISPFTKTPNQGAATTVYCAVYLDGTDIQGHYFSNCEKDQATTEANDPEVANKLWELSEEICAKYGLV